MPETKFVEILKLQNDGSQKVIATCSLVGSEVICDGDATFIGNLKHEGVFDNTSKKTLFPSDGLKFLETLRLAFKSGYLNASEVKSQI